MIYYCLKYNYFTFRIQENETPLYFYKLYFHRPWSATHELQILEPKTILHLLCFISNNFCVTILIVCLVLFFCQQMFLLSTTVASQSSYLQAGKVFILLVIVFHLLFTYVASEEKLLKCFLIFPYCACISTAFQIILFCSYNYPIESWKH